MKTDRNIDGNIELISFTSKGAALAAALARQLNQAGYNAACTRDGLPVRVWTSRAFSRADALIFVGAVGIAVRAIAPYLIHKASDPAVVVIDETGQFIIPILSGHLGGANDLARFLATVTGGQSVITTASDRNGVFSFDQWARHIGCAVPYPERIQSVARKLLEGETVSFESQWPISGQLPRGVEYFRNTGDSAPDVILSIRDNPAQTALILTPRIVCLGIGCRKNLSPIYLDELYDLLLSDVGILKESVKTVATIALKANEPAILQFCRVHDLPLRIFTAEELSRAEGTFCRSEFVRTVTGVDNVCERAAVLAADGGEILCHKTCRNGATMALAIADFTPQWDNMQTD